MTHELSDADRARLRRSGVAPFAFAEGLELFDFAMRPGRVVLVPMRIDTAGAARPAPATGRSPRCSPASCGCTPQASGDAADSLSRRLAQMPESGWDDAVLELVRDEVGVVLGLASRRHGEPQRAFQELGFSSLDAIELRNRLATTTGLRLPATLIFDHPNPAALAEYVRSRVTENGVARAPVEEELDRLEAILAELAEDEGARARAQARLRAFNARLDRSWRGARAGTPVLKRTVRTAVWGRSRTRRCSS